MTDNRHADSAACSVTRRGFLGAAAAATVAIGRQPQVGPTSRLLNPRLQALVGRQEQGILIDSKTSTLGRLVLLHCQQTFRECEVSIQSLPSGFEVTVLGESEVLAKVLPGLGLGLQAARLAGIDLDRYGCLADTPEQVLRLCAGVFKVLPSQVRDVTRLPAVIDWPMLWLLELVVDRFPELDVSGSGPFGRLEICLPDGGVCVSRDSSDDRMKLHVWVDEWRGLLLPQFEGFRGLSRYVDSLLATIHGLALGPVADPQVFLYEPRALLTVIGGVLAVECLTISVAL